MYKRQVRDLSQRKTVILISHRLANVKKADKIYVMKSGSIEEAGIHRDLIDVYKRQQNIPCNVREKK